MQLFTTFLSIFSLIFIHFWVSRAASECKLVHSKPKTITVDLSGRGNFKSIQSAINSIPSYNNKWVRIHVLRGIYKEKILITHDKPCIILEGQGRGRTIITGDSTGSIDQTATFTSFASNFVAKRITIKNSHNLVYAAATAAARNFKSNPITQAVAARILGDKSSFHKCAFLGLQDTLWDGYGRHYFNSCYIEGAVDFIFGSGQSFYEDCTINATAGLLLPNIRAGYITAQGRNSPKDPSGFVFLRPKIYGTSQVYFGRAYGAYSRVIFQDGYININIAAKGWYAWNYKGHERDFTYAEVNCKGPRYNTSKRVKWMERLTGSELQQFTRSAFIDQDHWISSQP